VIGVEFHFTSDQQTRLARIAEQEGIEVRLIEADERFRSAVREGIGQADRGEFIEEKEMDARLQEMLAGVDADTLDD